MRLFVAALLFATAVVPALAHHPFTISGWPAKDPTARAFSGREVTFADGSTILFGHTPQEGDRWRCVSGCNYRYPEPN